MPFPIWPVWNQPWISFSSGVRPHLYHEDYRKKTTKIKEYLADRSILIMAATIYDQEYPFQLASLNIHLLSAWLSVYVAITIV
jgi:hypothetical protein